VERELSILAALCLLLGCHHSADVRPSPDAGAPVEVIMTPRIYQLFVRTFGNVNLTNQYDGDIKTNGCGKFEDINEAALNRLKDLGATHLWLTGVLRQATLTDYSAVDARLTPDDPDIVKGRAGSPYAIRDYFDVSPDYARDPVHRLEEFQALVRRIHTHGMKAVIDLVPNHVGRSYRSVVKPQLDFGKDDDRTTFFKPSNDFYYLVDPPGAPLLLSYPAGAPPRAGRDGRFIPEDGTSIERTPRATGNNQTSHSPGSTDWYEVIKLNYGYNFVDGTSHYDPLPPSWTKMDAVIEYWQAQGVDGFRCDFSHWVPVEFWRWAIGRARQRGPVYFFAEVYDNPDAAPGYSKAAFIGAGFDALYDGDLYNGVKRIFAGGGSANDLDGLIGTGVRAGHDLRYAENHDERRAASPVTAGDPGNSGFGSTEGGFAVTALLHLLGPDPVLLYNGQEVGEPGLGAEGYGGDDGRTTIFDYWAMPEYAKWVNGHAYDGAGLSDLQRALRRRYASLWSLRQEPAIAQGEFFSLQPANQTAAEYGEQGRWVYAYVRTDPERGQSFLVVVNLSDSRAFQPHLRLTSEALNRARLPHDGATIELNDRLSAFTTRGSGAELLSTGVQVDLPPSTARVLELRAAP
jgi:glycosidase